MSTLSEIRSRYREEALRRGLNPRDVDLLLADLTGKSLPYLISHGDEPFAEDRLKALFERRVKGEPLQYIRGRVEFYSREFLVDSRVLIPRPETEILVENALQFAKAGSRVVDIGTGSGCIAITMERERPDIRMFATDVSIAAISLAATNARRLGSNVRFAASDILSAMRGRFDLVVSNPPYIAAAEVETLAAEVKDHEPRIALTPGPAGTEAIERILDQAAGARVILEISYGQEAAIREVAATHHYTVENVIPDLAAIPRVVVLSRHGQ